MMRAPWSFLVLARFCPAAAASLREDGDYFQAGADVGRFEADNQNCAIAADDYVTYDLKGMSGTGYDQNRAYNSVYARCMTGRGYRPRPYARNWLNGG